MKCFKGEAMFPNLVGLPRISPLQFSKSSMVAYGAPAFGILGVDSVSVANFNSGTVRRRASIPSMLSTP